MKKTLLLLAFSFFFLRGWSQPHSPYQSSWIKIDTLEKRGLYRSAWSEAAVIFADASRRGDRQEQIKALIYELTYRSKIEEGAEMANIRQTDSLMTVSDGTAKSILQSMLAELYGRYAAANRYRLYERLPSAAEDESDPATWSLGHFYRRMAELYAASVTQRESLGKIRLRDLHVLVDTGNSLRLRPTLYDLLAHRALDFYSGPETDAMFPGDRFILLDPGSLSDAAAFERLRFPSADSASLTVKALQLYQALLGFHRSDADQAAWMEANLDRLRFAYQKAAMSDKDSLYLSQLREMTADSHGYPAAAAEATCALASWYYAEGSRYDPFTHPAGRGYLKKALDLASAVPTKPVGEAAVTALGLKQEILRPALSLTLEEVTLPGKPFLISVGYKQIPRLWLRLVRLPADPRSVSANPAPDAGKLLARPAMRQWMQTLPDPGDYQQHTVEIKADALSVGRYALIASGSSDFSDTTSCLVDAVFSVSQISCITNGKGDFFVLDRETGHPLENALVNLWKTVYNYTTRRPSIDKAGAFHTDAQGHFRADTLSQAASLLPEIIWQKDHLYTGDARFVPLVRSSIPAKDSVQEETLLFTDRSIYRPGQTLFFKGIVLKKQLRSQESHVVTDRPLTVYLVDANGRRSDSMTLSTNAFGSVSGSFVLHTGQLNGSLRLETSVGGRSASFSVEAYKRPTFFLDWDTTARAYRLEDTVDAAGLVKTYSDVPVGNATVSYQVTRRTRIRMPYYFGRPFIPPAAPAVTIAQGTVSTDENGRFRIVFPALPDETTDSSLLPVFTYTVSATVTDAAGESHDFNREIPLGYRSMELALTAPDKVDLHRPDTLQVTTTDLSGRYLASTVTLRLIPLETPHRYIRPRYWGRPDQHALTRAAYLNLFPHDEYADESDPGTWVRKEPVWSHEVTTTVEGAVPLGTSGLAPGWYLLEAVARDSRGRPDTSRSYLQLYDGKTSRPVSEDPLWVSAETLKAVPGQEARWLLASTTGAWIIRQDENVEGPGKIRASSQGKEVSPVSLPVDAGDRGGMLVHYVTVRDNRVYTADIRVTVPWSDKQLSITYETFRDKLLPGSREQWRVRISGAGADKASAELLASMYDASLDGFRPHAWDDATSLYPTVPGSLSWGNGPGFRAAYSETLRYPAMTDIPSYTRIDPALNWFGYLPSPPRVYYMLRGRSALPAGAMRKEAAMDLTAPAPVADSAGHASASPVSEGGIQPRTRFDETAFFLPQLVTGDDGEITFSFTVPDALTRWKLMLFAHSKDLAYAYSEKEVVTQKPLMIQPAFPRFLRQGDRLRLSARVSNLTGDSLQGQATLSLYDLGSGKPLDSVFGAQASDISFTAGASSTAIVNWTVKVPETYSGALGYRVTAAAGDYTDGEQQALPVLSNAVLVTETLPLYLRGNGTHTFHWDALDKMPDGILPQALTVEYASNPVWYAILTLPFFDQQLTGKESADALFQRYYANALSGLMAATIPGFRSTMTQWVAADSAALKSPLAQNESLKSVLLSETPWVNDAEKESARRAQVASWYSEGEDLRLSETLEKLGELQLPDGSFGWFTGMPGDRFTTQGILTGIGHLRALDAWPAADSAALQAIAERGVHWLDVRLAEDYRAAQRRRSAAPAIDVADIAYLYMRSFFPEIIPADSVRTASAFYLDLARRGWTGRATAEQAMIALTLSRHGDLGMAKTILASLRETALRDEAGGIYWKTPSGYRPWGASAITTQTLCMEAFREIARDSSFVSDLCAWLVTQKQAHLWPTDAGTADALWALMAAGRGWATATPQVTIKAGRNLLITTGEEPGAGYHRMTLPGADIRPEMKTIDVSVKKAAAGQPSWGAAYFQYLQRMDQVERADAPLAVSREIDVEETGPDGTRLVPVTRGRPLRVGDKAVVKMTVRSAEDLDYVDLKDTRATCMEPLQALSGYRQQNGTGYYGTTGDAAVHFYFPHLAKGTYVFTYPVYVTQAGNYTGGLSTVTCLYAPQFGAHSEGGRLEVAGK